MGAEAPMAIVAPSAELIRPRRGCATPSPLNGERAGVRGEKVRVIPLTPIPRIHLLPTSTVQSFLGLASRPSHPVRHGGESETQSGSNVAATDAGAATAPVAPVAGSTLCR